MATNRRPVCTADEALERLKAGNARFVSGRAHFPTVHKEILAELGNGQHPYATILGCSDSRVPPKLVFDAGFGDANVRHAVREILATPEAQASLATGDMKLVGAVYRLDSGAVDFLA